MQITPIKNQNFEKPSRNLSDRTKGKILKKIFFWISLKKIWFRVCSVTAEMFEYRNSGENRRKRSEFFFENLRKAYKDLIYVKKNSKLSHACVPLSKTTNLVCQSLRRKPVFGILFIFLSHYPSLFSSVKSSINSPRKMARSFDAALQRQVIKSTEKGSVEWRSSSGPIHRR